MSDAVEWVIGPGVQEAMAAAGDAPRSHEQYVILLEGHQVSQTYGRDAVYYYVEEDGAVKRCPFR